MNEFPTFCDCCSAASTCELRKRKHQLHSNEEPECYIDPRTQKKFLTSDEVRSLLDEELF